MELVLHSEECEVVLRDIMAAMNQEIIREMIKTFYHCPRVPESISKEVNVQMWGTVGASIPTKEQVLDSLFQLCSIRTFRTIEIVNKMSQDLKLNLESGQIDKLVEIIQPYKQSGKNLESTVNAVYDVIRDINSVRIDND